MLFEIEFLFYEVIVKSPALDTDYSENFRKL